MPPSGQPSSRSSRRLRAVAEMLRTIFALAAMLLFVAPWFAGVWALGILLCLGLGASDSLATAAGLFMVPVWFLFGAVLWWWADRAEKRTEA